MIFWIIISILAIQRISELFIAKANERRALASGAKEYDPKGYIVIVFMHVAFFLSFIAEYYLMNKILSRYWTIFIGILVVTEILRYWSLISLGKYWNTKILVIPGASIVRTGPYKYIKHPNYLAVVIEIAIIPLLFSCYITSGLFTVLNLLVLRRRIRIEENALSQNQSV